VRQLRLSMPELSPRAFSFNSPHGGCPDCQGLGALWDFDPDRIVPDQSRTLLQGAIAPWASGDQHLVTEAVTALGRNFDIDVNAPFGRLPKRAKDLLLYGRRRRRGRTATAAPTGSAPARPGPPRRLH